MKRLLLLPALLAFQFLSAQIIPTLTWENSTGGTTDDYGFFVNTTADGGYIMVGSATSADGDLIANFGDYDLLLTKFDNTGATQWVKNLGGSLLDAGYSVSQTPEGGYLITGYTRSSDGQVGSNYGMRDVWIVKTNALGTIQWENNYGGSADERMYSTISTSDGGYIMAGYTESNDNDITMNQGSADVWVVKIDSAGTLLWQKTYGGISGDYGNHISATMDGGYVVTAYSYSNSGDLTGNNGGADVWIFKINNTGTLLWQDNYGGSDEDYCTATYEVNTGGYISLNYTYSSDGDVTSTHGNLENWLFRTNSAGVIVWDKGLGGTDADGNYAMKKTMDGKYVIAGYTYSADGDIDNQHGGGESDYWIVKADTSGTIEWQKCFGGTGDDEAFSIVQAADSSFVVTGISSSADGDITANSGTYDAWTINVKPTIITGLVGAQNIGEPVVYPNPGSGIFRFRNLCEKSNIRIYDAFGKMILLVQNADSTQRIDLSEQAKGIYFYQVLSSQGTLKSGRMIIQ